MSTRRILPRTGQRAASKHSVEANARLTGAAMRGRRFCSVLSLVVAVLMLPVTVLVGWTESEILSTGHFVAALADTPALPAVRAEVITLTEQAANGATASLPSPLGAAVVDPLLDGGISRGVPAVLTSPAFLGAWQVTLRSVHSQLISGLRGHNPLFSISGSGLDVTLPFRVGSFLPVGLVPESLRRSLSKRTLSLTILSNRALAQARTAVQLTDDFSHALPALNGLAFIAGVMLARRRRRALFIASLAATAIAGLAAGTVSAITHAASGDPVAAAVVHALTFPLQADLLWTAGGFLLVAFAVTVGAAFRPKRVWPDKRLGSSRGAVLASRRAAG